MNPPTRDALLSTLAASGALTLARAGAARRGVVVLTLHRVVPDAELARVRSPRGMVLRESLFARLVAYLAEECRCVALADALETPRRNHPRVLVTFDDGWADTLEIAAPHLRRAGLPWCVFATTGLTGMSEPFWVERFLGLAAETSAQAGLHRALAEWPWRSPRLPLPGLPALERDPESFLPFLKQFSPATLDRFLHAQNERPNFDPRERLLSWPELCGLHREGVPIGAHTVTHPLLTQLAPAQLREELRCSRMHLATHVAPSEALAYPNGDANPQVVAAARAAGYRYGFLNSPGLWTTATDPLAIPRVNVWDGMLTDAQGRFSAARLGYSLFWRT